MIRQTDVTKTVEATNELIEQMKSTKTKPHRESLKRGPDWRPRSFRVTREPPVKVLVLGPSSRNRRRRIQACVMADWSPPQHGSK